MWVVLFLKLIHSSFADDDVTISQLPEVIFASPAVYPKEALRDGRGGVVELELYIDSEGFVLDAKVITPIGQGFDESAISAVRNYQFSPALDNNGNAIASQIIFNFTFEPQNAPQLSVQGQLFEAGIREPLQDFTLLAIDSSGRTASITTDQNGSFSFYGLEEGSWIITADSPEFLVKTENVDIQSKEVTNLKIYLVRDQAVSNLQVDAELVIEEKREGSDITERFLTASEIEYLPGSGGDVVKAVQNLPGIARAPLGVGQLIIRGTAPEDSSYYIDGGNIPDVFHFGGLTTVLSPDNIAEVAFLPGNYSVRYGRQLGGVVDIRTNSKFPERNRGYLSIDLYQSALFVEQKLQDNVSLALSGRRSYADFFLNPLLSNSDISVRAPRYYDFQSRLIIRPNNDEIIDALFFLSNDRFAFLGKDSEGNEQTAAAFGKTFQKFRGKYTKRYNDLWSTEKVLVVGPAKQDFAINGDNDAYETLWEINLRDEYVRQLSLDSNIGWKMGIDLYSGFFDFLYDLPSFPGDPEGGTYSFISPAVYLENTLRRGRMDIISGIRAEGYTLSNSICFPAYDPRISSRLAIGDFAFVKMGAGIFSQFPTPRQGNPDSDGNPDLNAQKSYQFSVGYEQGISSALKLELTGFYNLLDDIVVGREDRFRFFTGPPPIGPFDTKPYANAGGGQIYGLESQIRYNGPNTIGLISGTFSRSERTTRDGKTRLFAYDQPFVVNALLSQQLSKNRRFGFRIRYSAGNPYTPVVNRVYDLNSRIFFPVYGERDSGRIDPFFALDLRFDKDYTFDTWKLTTYIDIQNATYAKNTEVMAWSYDYTVEEPIEGQPPFPIFGIKGEW